MSSSRKVDEFNKVDESIMKTINPQMDKFKTDESKLLSHKVDGFIRTRDEHTATHILKATNMK